MPIHILSHNVGFPPANRADNSGLLAVGGDLKPDRLIEAYSNGIFPWYSEGDPILWFSPNPRMVLYPEKFNCSQSLKRILNSNAFEVRIDTSFEAVINACRSIPRPGQSGTWITQDMVDAYLELNRLGIAHSFESYAKGQLVGGLYGVSLGAAFFGESMFHTAPNASKVAFARLVSFARTYRFHFIDAQTPSDHLKRLGAEKVSRKRFLSELSRAMEQDSLNGSWSRLLERDALDSHRSPS